MYLNGIARGEISDLVGKYQSAKDEEEAARIKLTTVQSEYSHSRIARKIAGQELEAIALRMFDNYVKTTPGIPVLPRRVQVSVFGNISVEITVEIDSKGLKEYDLTKLYDFDTAGIDVKVTGWLDRKTGNHPFFFETVSERDKIVNAQRKERKVAAKAARLGKKNN